MLHLHLCRVQYGMSLSLSHEMVYIEMIQEGLAAAFGNGLSTACIVNMGAQVTSVICVEVCSRCF